METVLFGLIFCAGILFALSARAGLLGAKQSSDVGDSDDHDDGRASGPELLAGAEAELDQLRPSRSLFTRASRESSKKRTLSPVAIAQVSAGVAGLVVGWWATQLIGMALLLAGLGILLPPFMAAPRRRRRQTRNALAWQLWSRQLAELARSGAGLGEALRGSVEHAPPEVASVVERVAATADMHGLETAIEELANSGDSWEPEVAAGLLMATTTGGPVADPLLDLCERIGDVVELHRSKTEAVVQLWTQTIALLALAAGVIILMYINNPAYFEPYRNGSGQLVLSGIAGILLFSIGFLVYHSVVREERSVLVPGPRRREVKEPL